MKRILALDGGGVRGIFALQVLARIEQLFREEQGRPDLVLEDVFDMFAGTSTGAIIAACLAWRMPVAAIEQLYIEHGREMFAKQSWYNRWKTKYRADTLEETFKGIFFEDTPGREPALLGTGRIRKTLLVLMRNASTGSPWPVSNNPAARFNLRDFRGCNLDIPLWRLLRASTAAPTYFPPEEISLGGEAFLFVDGGMTPFNNPALIAVLAATLPAYKICWPTGREALHVISVGTGSSRACLPHKVAAKIHMLDQIKFIAPALMGSASVEQDVLCRVMGDCVHGDSIDLELGALTSPSLFTPEQQRFTYARYDQALCLMPVKTVGALKQSFELDDLQSIPLLKEAGQAYAATQVRLEDLFPRRSAA